MENIIIFMKDITKPKKILLISTGSFLVGVGIAGIFIPILPTTPFLLLAAALYARSSQKFYRWLINNRILGRYIKDYREGRGIPVKVKIIAITLLWATISCSAYFATDILWVRIILFTVAIGVSIHIIRIMPRDKYKTGQYK
jgi:uncharacterized protein